MSQYEEHRFGSQAPLDVNPSLALFLRAVWLWPSQLLLWVSFLPGKNKDQNISPAELLWGLNDKTCVAAQHGPCGNFLFSPLDFQQYWSCQLPGWSRSHCPFAWLLHLDCQVWLVKVNRAMWMAPLKWQICIGKHQWASSAPRESFHPSLGHFLLCFTMAGPNFFHHSLMLLIPLPQPQKVTSTLSTDGGHQYEHISLYLPTSLILTSILPSLLSSQLKGWHVPLLPKTIFLII